MISPYEFKPEDAWNFARAVNIQCFARNGELHFRECPYCGGKSNDKRTFAISLKTGQFKCLRDSCGAKGNMLTLVADFKEFSLGNTIDEYYKPKKVFKTFKKPEAPIVPKDPALRYLQSRGIGEKVAKEYQITVQTNEPKNLVIPFFDEKGNMPFIKYRKTDYVKGGEGSKEWCQAGGKPILFGMMQCNLSYKTLTVTEGQMDSLSLAQAGIPNAVSVPTGAKGFTWVPYCWNWVVNNFDTIIVFGDLENGHMSLYEDFRQRFSKLRIKHVQAEYYRDCKDANEILQKYGEEYLRTCVSTAVEAKSRRIKKVSEVENVNIYDIPKLKTGIYCLDKFLIGGLPFGGVTLVAGKTGEGKSALSSQIIASALESGHKVFAYSGELPDHVFKAWINYQIAGKNHITVNRIEYDNEKYEISDTNINLIEHWYDDNLYIYDDLMIEDEFENLTKTIEDAIIQCGCDVILVDNLMTALDLEILEGSDKYDIQSKLVKKMARMAKAYDVLIILVAHKRKNNYGINENDEVSGSSDITNLGTVTLSYERGSKTELEQGEIREDQRKLKVVKNRFFGAINTSGWILDFEPKSRRIYGENDDPNKEYGWTKGLVGGFDDVSDLDSIPFD